MSLYTAIKLLHMSCATISITGFTLRGLMKLFCPQRLEARWLRIAPHINDTLLLGCAIYLAITLGQYPGTSSWLTAKVIGLTGYILMGMTLMKWASTQTQRWLAFLAAIGCFSYIVWVAVTRQPLPWV